MANERLLESLRFEELVLEGGKEVPRIAAASVRARSFHGYSSSRPEDFGNFSHYSETIKRRSLDDEELISGGELLKSGPLKECFHDSGDSREGGEESIMALNEVKSLVGKRNQDVVNLEKLLRGAYQNSGIQITNIEALPITRKDVKRVFFSMNEGLYQVWVFKASPGKTLRELTAYYIAHKQGLPTARPIGFEPKPGMKDYNFDVAILGGIVEHAGEPYDSLISHLSFTPDLIFRTAGGVAKILADFHFKLTRAGKEFERYGLKIDRVSPGNEIRERFVSALKLDESSVKGLIEAAEDLYNSQEGELVISHGDVHTGNIVTRTNVNKQIGQNATLYDKFGLIDMGSLVLDYPQGDLADFWLHHQRKAIKVCENEYPFDYEMFQEAYLNEWQKQGGHLARGVRKNQNVYVAQALWNLYEMFDPVRKEGLDVPEKARFHSYFLKRAVADLHLKGLGERAERVRNELAKVLKKTAYADLV